MERRLYERIPTCSDCILRIDDGIELQGKLWDISKGGVCIAIYEDFRIDIGDVCTISFTDDSKSNSNSYIVETITVSNITELANGKRIGAAFINDLSQQCLDYIHTLSARAILRSRGMLGPMDIK